MKKNSGRLNRIERQLHDECTRRILLGMRLESAEERGDLKEAKELKALMGLRKNE